MKRGKDEEKMMRPMFPRLHVNDADKGGPRAPPRNKMALYEQLSIPSQRFSRVVLPINPNSSPAMVPPSSQGSANERDVFLSYQLPTRHQPEKQYSQYSNPSTPLTPVEQRKILDEDDFRVPIFVNSDPSQECGMYCSDLDWDKIPFKTSYFNDPLKCRKSEKMGPDECSTVRESKIQKKENSRKFASGCIKTISNPLPIEESEGLDKQVDSPACDVSGDNPANVIDRIATGGRIEPALCSEAQAACERQSAAILGENITAPGRRNSSVSATDVPSEDQNVFHNLSNNTDSHENRSCRLERGDSVSETSGVDSISTLDITPDDVVGLIGQNHFWKARSAIANQQRVFALQVFELHRLMKVQRLIAASPHLLLKDPAYLGKSVKAAPEKRILLNSPVKKIPNVSKQNGEREKPSHKKEGSAKNTTVNASFKSIQNGLSTSSFGPLSSNSPAPSVNSGPWCFNQPNGQQWLIPVMSPTEGLIYKPYPGPGFVGPASGGHGPPGPTPVMANSFPPPYGVPAPHPQYQMPLFPAAPPQGYFPNYDMPIMNPAAYSGSSGEQLNFPAVPGLITAGNQNLSTMPSHGNQASADALSNMNASKDVEVQASTASSHSDRTQDGRANSEMEGRSVLPLFPMSQALDVPDSNPQSPEPELPTKVIRVVPHNARSATEFAARIFRSIQEERKQQHDSL